MSHEERNTVASIIAAIMLNAYVVWKLRAMFDDGRLTGDGAIQTWAQTMLWIVPVGIGLVIATIILFTIFHAIATGEPNPSFLVDERDHAIQGFGMKVTMIVTSIGFVGMVIALAVGTAPLSALIGLWFAFAAGDIIGKLAMVVRYRRGY